MAFFTNLVIGMVSMMFLSMTLMGLQSPSKKE